MDGLVWAHSGEHGHCRALNLNMIRGFANKDAIGNGVIVSGIIDNFGRVGNP